ncbi:MAG TPA: N-acetylneuraminate synthase family protein [Phycisphaerae bacterium]|jgi:N-acetylneuraminate synthase/N,N'-diacetyllegionaminate synthase
MAAKISTQTISTVTIGSRPIGEHQRTFVIAEAGVNHNGNLGTAIALTEAAAEAGADAVKFQIFTADELAGSAPTAAYQRAATGAAGQRDMLRTLELRDEDFRAVAVRARRSGLEFLATPFSIPDLRRLQSSQPAAVKIASTDINNAPLLTAAAQTGLPLIVSTGASLREELDAAVKVLGSAARGRLILLHCVSAYPAPWNLANLRAIRAMQQRYNLPVGFSDHTTSTQIGALAVAAGACVLEKHFTLDRGAPGPDHAMSLDPRQLSEYVAAVRRAEEALGSGALGMSAAELEVRRIARKSVVAARRIDAGEILTPTMLSLKRPEGGIPPNDFARLVGRVVLTAIEADAPIHWEMVQ